ncbi:N-acetylmannosamine-6-phosphate 2-epimerase [Thorsellia anophelis]
MTYVNDKLEDFKRELFGKIIVSIQPVEKSPLDTGDYIVAVAKAAKLMNVPAIRIQGVDNVRIVSSEVDIPIIGIVKRDLDDSPVRITPFIEDVIELKKAGAAVIAFDATDRIRPISRESICHEIHKAGCFAMADCAAYEDGIWAAKNNVEFIGTTLSGYTTPITPLEPDFELIKSFKKAGLYTIAEGRFNTPELTQKAILSGADCVTVGSALTRFEVVLEWFNNAISK